MQLNGHELIILLEGLGAAGVAVSLATKILKKLAKGHLDDDIHKVVLALTAMAGGAQYLDQLHAVLPPYVLGVTGTSIYGVSQLVYRGANVAINVLAKIKAKNDNAPAPLVTSETPAAAPAPPPATF